MKSYIWSRQFSHGQVRLTFFGAMLDTGLFFTIYPLTGSVELKLSVLGVSASLWLSAPRIDWEPRWSKTTTSR